MAKRSSDYIPTIADQLGKLEARKEYMATHPDPRPTYAVKYTLYGKEHTEEVIASTQADAIEEIKRGWWMNGIIIDVISAVQVRKSEKELQEEAAAKENADGEDAEV